MGQWALKAAFVLAGAALGVQTAVAQQSVSDETSYRMPPKAVSDIILRAPSPNFSLSPDDRTLLLMQRESLPPVSELAKPMERLAGMRLDAATNDTHGPRRYVGLTLKDIQTGQERPVALPENADVDGVMWSPDGSKAAFRLTGADGVGLWVLDVASGTASAVMATGVNPILQAPAWMPDGTLLVAAVPADRGAKPVRSLTPGGPAISEAAGGEKAQTRTYQDLLKDPHDEAMFRWLATSQLVIVDPATRARRNIGEAGLHAFAAPSPNGEYLLVETLAAPFSYQVPYYRFPMVSEIWGKNGTRLKEFARAPLADNLPVQGVITGPRRIHWHPTAPARLMWAEALDGGDPKTESDARDRVMMQDAPFDGARRELIRLEDRYSGIYGLEASEDLVVTDYDRDTREVRRQLVYVDGSNAPKVIELRNYQDSYADPGSPLMKSTPAGKRVARVHKGAIYMRGNGATPEGYRPFLRSLDLNSLKTREIWRNSDESYERVIDVLEDGAGSLLTLHESPTSPPNGRVWRADGGSRTLTNFPDPHPELTGIERELITYDRGDGVQLTATLYLPPGHKAGEKLPVVVWAYPYEYSNAETAGQVRDSPYRFTRIAGYSQLFFLTQGYAVLDRAAMPVIGADPETVNDTFIEQITAAGDAAVAETVKRGFGDGERVGVGGHSYGAFMTAHLLAQSDTFKAGIARSGAYNRTLTPFGFQAERRIFWETPETYYKLSPFMAANKINEPMLMIHGMKDNNSGTFPQQSERMFAAIKGTGGTAKLVMLPHESHGYRGRESILHTMAEMIDWFDLHVKNAGVSAASEAASE